MPDVKIPEVIKLGDVEYKVSENPEILRLVTAVRSQEKNKLYSEIKTKESELKDVQNKLKGFEGSEVDRKKKLDELNQEIGTLKEAKKTVDAELAGLKKVGADADKDKDKDKLTEEVVAKRVTEALAEQEAKFAEKLKDNSDGVEDKLKQREVADYKKEKLAEYKDVIIPEFVSGSTKEELDASIAEAVVKSKKFLHVDYKGKRLSLDEKESLVLEEKKAEELALLEKTKGAGSAEPPKTFGADLSGQELLNNVDKMSDAEYEKNREAIMREAKAVSYGNEE